MGKQRRTFSPAEKHSILQEAEREGITETCRKYNLAHSVVNYWKKKYLDKGKQSLLPGYRKIDPKVKELEIENERLRRIVSKQALEIEFKDELIKKGHAHLQKGRRS